MEQGVAEVDSRFKPGEQMTERNRRIFLLRDIMVKVESLYDKNRE